MENHDFALEYLHYQGEPDAAMRGELQKICDLIFATSSSCWKPYVVEDFKDEYGARAPKKRFINEDRDIWMIFLGATDGTHAPKGFRESEWILFYYRGFAVEFFFVATESWSNKFKLEHVNVHKEQKKPEELATILHEKGIDRMHYFHELREALDAYCAYWRMSKDHFIL